MKVKTQITGLLLFCRIIASAQDTAAVTRPERPHEIGISILTPMLMLAGASESQERFSNLTYRFMFTENHAARAFVGAAPGINQYNTRERTGIMTSPGTTLYVTEDISWPSNFQVGAGYEFIRGGRLKHSIGVDLVYNNKFEKHQHYIVQRTEDKDQNGTVIIREKRLDSAAFNRGINSDKIGLNSFFSLRYELSRKWLVTGSTIATFRYSTTRDGTGRSSAFDFNLVALISDISLFYRF